MDIAAGGVWMLNGDDFGPPILLPTGKGAHGLYVSRDSRSLCISKCGEGTISVLDFASGRYHSEVYAISTEDGRLLARIPVGAGPHGLCVYPQPGRYSLDRTGIFR